MYIAAKAEECQVRIDFCIYWIKTLTTGNNLLPSRVDDDHVVGD